MLRLRGGAGQRPAVIPLSILTLLVALSVATWAHVEPGASATTQAASTATETTAAPRTAAASPTEPTGGSQIAAPTGSDVVVRAPGPILPGAVNRTSIQLTAEYDVKVSLNFGTRALGVDSTMTVRNDSGGPIDRVELNTIAARLGAMRLRAVTVEGTAARATVDDQTIVVALGGILGAGQSVRIRVAYTATLRSDLVGSNWLFTRTNGIVDAYRWLPWVSLRTPFNRPNHGDPFVTALSPRVHVVFTTDRPLVFATSGQRTGGSRLSQRFDAVNVRDFAFTAAPDYRTVTSSVGGKTIRVYYRPGFPATAALAAARSALAKMSSLVGPYPYDTYAVAQSAGGFGMESPGLTWIPTGIARSNLRYLVHHETGHQWFYSLVGNNQATQPWADEAATDFLARYALGMRQASRCSTARLDLSIYRYSKACYYEIVYIQGGNFLDDLRRQMGSTAFWRGLRAYVAANRFQFGSTSELLDTLDAYTPLNLVPRFHPRFPGLY